MFLSTPKIQIFYNIESLSSAQNPDLKDHLSNIASPKPFYEVVNKELKDLVFGISFCNLSKLQQQTIQTNKDLELVIKEIQVCSLRLFNNPHNLETISLRAALYGQKLQLEKEYKSGCDQIDLMVDEYNQRLSSSN
jgi:hypothetical protein